MFRALLFVFCALCATGCGRNFPFAPAYEPAISGGIPLTAEQYPAVVRITKGKSYCTAEFVLADPPTVLTASHCLADLDDPTGGVEYEGRRAINAFYPQGATGKSNRWDLAVVVFDRRQVRAPAVLALSDRDPVPDEEIELVGFGRNDGREKPGPFTRGKRLGVNTIKKIVGVESDTWFHMLEIHGALFGDWRGPGKRPQGSGTAHGDSGGAVILAATGKLVGINSGGKEVAGEKDQPPYRRSHSVNLRDTPIRAFLESLLANPSLLVATRQRQAAVRLAAR